VQLDTVAISYFLSTLPRMCIWWVY